MPRFKRVFSLVTGSYVAYRLTTDRQARADLRGLLSSVYNSVQAFSVLVISVADYAYGLHGLDPQFQEYHDKRCEIHHRVATRILQVSVKSRGVYFKAGQYLGNLDRIMPEEYTKVLHVLQDSAPPLPWSQIQVVLENSLPDYRDHFEMIHKEAIAAASLAQVHRGLLKDGREVAVKLQYPFLYTQSIADFKVLWVIIKLSNWFLRKSDCQDIDLMKLWKTFRDMCEKEINFEIERKNAESSRRLFHDEPQVYVPKVYRELSGQKVLTMEYVRGCKISDVNGLRAIGFAGPEVADLLVKLFGRMMFVEGHVHCDPHPGNLLIKNVGGRPQLILLDHGFYTNLSADFKQTFNRLWESLVTFDYPTLKELSEDLGLGTYYKYLPLVFTYRTIQSTQPLGETLTDQERRQLHINQDLSFDKISRLLQLLPPEMMFVIRTSNLVAIHNLRLGGTTKDRLYTYTNIAYHAMYGNSLWYLWHTFKFYLLNFFYMFFPSFIKVDPA